MNSSYIQFFLISLIFICFSSYAMNPTEKSKINYVIRPGNAQDRDNLKLLYRQVAAIPGGLARTADEITDDYIDKILANALTKGLIFVAEYNGQLIGSLLKYKLEPKVFAHVLSEGSILVHPDFQGSGIGTNLFLALFKELEEHRPDIYRVEIVARESNPAIKLYERLGFKKEGRFEGRIKNSNGSFEADIPMAWFNKSFKPNA
ncbi:GNAT family N-acetyltransferase [Candidatus Dependentiae bacterium]|nr:GNAT family N-acetyltransferase [Candidatus Dependentiae bacterium]